MLACVSLSLSLSHFLCVVDMQFFLGSCTVFDLSNLAEFERSDSIKEFSEEARVAAHSLLEVYALLGMESFLMS